MKRKSMRIALACLALLAIGAGAGWWQAGRTQARVASFLPRLPVLEQAPPELRERLTLADTRARQHFGAVKGLAELARVYHANGFFDEAARCYAALEQLQPGEPRWLHLHATILAGYGEIEPALALWQKVTALAPDYLAAQLRRGDSLLKANRPAEAAAAYEAALKIEPNNPYAVLGLARLDLEAGRLDQARSRLEQVVTQTNFALGYDLIVTLYERLGLRDRATAIRATTKASGAYRDPPDPWLDALLADCSDPYRLSLAAGMLARAHDPAAIGLLQRAAAIAPRDVSVQFQLGTLLAAEGDPDGALAQMRLCTELQPDFADGWAHLSALQAQRGDAAAAGRTLADGVKNCPQSPGLHLMLARQWQQAGRIGEAIAEYRTSISLRPNEADAYFELGTLFIRQNRFAEGVAEMQRAVEAEPGHPATLSVLELYAITTGDESAARRWFAAIRNQPRVSPEQFQRLVAAYRQQFGHDP